MSNHTDYPFNVDICGYNYTENRYELDHKTYPNRVIYGSETGRGINEWKAVRDSKYIFAQFIWTGLDYLGESGRYPSRGLNTGMIDFAGFLKPEGYLRKVMWSEEPVAYVGTTIPPRGGRGYQRGAQPMWNYRDGMEIAAVASFNTPYARLVLNGKVVGEERPYNSDTYMTSWVIPYEKGTLTVEGLNEEREVVTEYTLKTTGRPDSIVAQVDNDEISCNRGVAQIEIQIVDENGLPVFLADNKIQCMTYGPIRLLGLESGSNSDMTDNKARSKRVHNGRLVAYIQATGEPGRAGISFTSAWLKPCLVKIEVK